jgi:sigma-B regulation protein RsbU (phosphoserine phosphatase)
VEQESIWVFLLAGTVTFISVFIQIALRIGPFQRILRKQANRIDRIVVILLFGGFSILGTYMGMPLPSGAIGNVRDLGPIVAGLVGGPLVGLGVGLIGGIHRYFLRGLTHIPCALATILIGLASGFIHKFNRGKLIGLAWAALFTILMECFHMALILLIARPFDEALLVVETAIFPMILANSVGVVISIVFISHYANTNH